MNKINRKNNNIPSRHCKQSPAIHKTPAFSLVEMLMALLVASLLMAALAPVMTKKIDDKLLVDDISIPGLKVWAEPGDYTFTVPSETEYLYIQGSGGGGGGGGASVKKVGPVEISDGSFTIPKGVSKITFTLIGAGGGGGAGNGKVLDDACEYPFILPAFADSGKDLCVSTKSPIVPNNYLFTIKPDEMATASATCWVADPNDENSKTSYYCDTVSKPVASKYFTGGGCKKTICTNQGATHWCGSGHGYRFRLFSYEEMKRIIEASTKENNFKYLFGEGLDLAVHYYGVSYNVFGSADVATVSNESLGICKSSFGSFGCMPSMLNIQGGCVVLTDARGAEYTFFSSTASNTTITGQVRCVRELNNWNSFAGAGGSSGAKFIKTINVSPGDILYFTKGKAGKSGTPGQSAINYSGEESCITHYSAKEATNTIYCAGGGSGGNGASKTANGEALSNSYAAKCTIQKPGKNPETVTEGCTLAIGENGGMGYAPVQLTGGTGAGGLVGGGLDINNGEGQSALNTQYGYGGGGGSCKRGARTASECSKGGAGGPGYVSIGYDVISPGGGGGAGGSTAGNEYLKLKVTPLEIIYVTVGAGGNGGQNASFATKGGNTKVTINKGNKVVEFEGGFAGDAGSFTGESLNIMQSPGAGGMGGRYPDSNFELINQEEKAKGAKGGLSDTGYDGGGGGETRLGSKGACGGKQNLNDVCDNDSINGISGTLHNIVLNKYGGSGGGGGGSDGTIQGTGGEGGAGYLRIKWETNR